MNSLCKLHDNVHSLQLAASHSELTTSMSTTPVRGRLPAVWEKLMLSKRSYYSSLAHYNISLALLQLSSVVDAQQRNRLIHVLMNCHSRAAAALVEQTLRRPVYTDAAVETDYGRLLLGLLSWPYSHSPTVYFVYFLVFIIRITIFVSPFNDNCIYHVRVKIALCSELQQPSQARPTLLANTSLITRLFFTKRLHVYIIILWTVMHSWWKIYYAFHK